MKEVYNEIENERNFQDEKWGEQNHNPYKWLAILLEEIGEASKFILEDDFPGSKHYSLDWYRAELIQVAAVAIAMIECFDRNHPKLPETYLSNGRR